MNDEKLTKLIRQAINGDIAAFEEVVRQKAKQIIYISVKTMQNRQDGEDAAQEAMLKMYQHIGDLKDPDAFYTWMYQIVTRTCIDLERRKSREEYEYLEMTDELSEMRREFLPQEYVEDIAKRESLLKVIDSLPEFYRTVLLLFYYEEMSYQEISAVMGVPEKSVSNVLFRAKQRIREQMERLHSVKVDLTTFHKAAAVPVLSQLFQIDEAQMTPEVVERILTGVSAATGAALTGAKAAGSTVITGGSGTAASAGAGGTVTATGTSAKILAGIVAAVTAAGGAAYVLLPEGGQTLSAAASGQEERIIATLEDMIGSEAAGQLAAYAENQGEEADWRDFLEALEMMRIGGADDGIVEYELYHLEKQNKQLLILQAASAGGLQVAYRFTDSHEPAPQGPELIEAMGRWQP